jgi:Domain of unknown function (DUF4406)
MKIYLAGPMRGRPQFNRGAFRRWTETLRAEGHEIFSPQEHSETMFGRAVTDNPGGDERRIAGGDPLALSRTLFAYDLSWICSHADAVALLPDWQESRGASAEAAVARALRIIVRPVGEF